MNNKKMLGGNCTRSPEVSEIWYRAMTAFKNGSKPTDLLKLTDEFKVSRATIYRWNKEFQLQQSA